MAPPHPLRRISTGSLSSLHRSQDRQHTSPSGLDFLSPALIDLSDEATTLAGNVEKLNELHDALGTFNESFAGWLYAMKMNAFCVEWPEAPTQDSFVRAANWKEPEPIYRPPTPPSSAHPSSEPTQLGDATYATAYTVDEPSPPPKKAAPVKKMVPAGTNLAARKAALAAKKKRDAEISSIIETLPLEYRGSQPSQRIAMEKIIEKLMVKSTSSAAELVSTPDLPQPKVNKCLIALVAKKLVTKTSTGGKTLYNWQGP